MCPHDKEEKKDGEGESSPPWDYWYHGYFDVLLAEHSYASWIPESSAYDLTSLGDISNEKINLNSQRTFCLISICDAVSCKAPDTRLPEIIRELFKMG